MQGLNVSSFFTSEDSSRPGWPVLMGSALVVALTLAACVLLYWRSLKMEETIPGLHLGRTPIGGVPHGKLDAFIGQEMERLAQKEIILKTGALTFKVKQKDLGARVDLKTTGRRLRAVGKTGNFLSDMTRRVQARRGKLSLPLEVHLDRETALDYFTALKQKIDRPPIPSRLDLAQREVIPGGEGYLMRVYDCLAAAEMALRHNKDTVKLAVTITNPPGSQYEKIQIKHILGRFSTAYSQKQKDRHRGHNLKVGASKLDGKIIGPGETFSFNKTVGPRTESQGYRMAPVISEGELVDGMAGGACQLSSTLFAAAFFAGLDLVSSRPHTRPSSYIKMALDAAVAYPTTDLVLKNPYPFPVVLHYRVNQGRVRVEILGRPRPWRKVEFQREVKEVLPFTETQRPDPRVPRGRRVISQLGVPGFRLERRRLFYAEGADPQKVEKRELRYPPTTQYIKQGTGPADPKWEAPKKKEPFGEVPKQYSLSQ